ncbi:MAG TPA: PDZ domain-containing protein [Polyangia bacterium]|jgi:hypothetical protein
MGRPLHVLAVLGALAGIVLMVALLGWLGTGRRQAARAGSDVRLAAAVTPAARAAWLGLTVQPVTSMMRKRLGLPRSGVVVSDVAAGSPAAQAGLLRGDLLRQVAGNAVTRPADVEKALEEAQPGSSVRATVWRQGRVSDVELVAAAPPPAPPSRPAPLPEASVEVEVAWLGLDIVALSPAAAKEANAGPGVRGMLVDDVADGRGKDAGLVAGDVILAVNGKATRSIAELKEATKDAAGALVDILRNGRHLYVSIPPPGTTAAERRLMQQRLPVSRVAWEGGWAAPAWPPAAPAAAAPGQPAGWGIWLAPGWQAQATFGWQRTPHGAWPAPVRPARPAAWDVPVVSAVPPPRPEDLWPRRAEDLRAWPPREAWRGPELELRRAAPGAPVAVGGW